MSVLPSSPISGPGNLAGGLSCKTEAVGETQGKMKMCKSACGFSFAYCWGFAWSNSGAGARHTHIVAYCRYGSTVMLSIFFYNFFFLIFFYFFK